MEITSQQPQQPQQTQNNTYLTIGPGVEAELKQHHKLFPNLFNNYDIFQLETKRRNNSSYILDYRRKHRLSNNELDFKKHYDNTFLIMQQNHELINGMTAKLSELMTTSFNFNMDMMTEIWNTFNNLEKMKKHLNFRLTYFIFKFKVLDFLLTEEKLKYDDIKKFNNNNSYGYFQSSQKKGRVNQLRQLKNN
jgi:hypothetical protein